MNNPQDRKLEELALEATRTGMSRLTFMQRALALSISTSAIAWALDSLEGPTGARAAAAPQISLNFSSWGSLDEQVTVNQLLEVFQKRDQLGARRAVGVAVMVPAAAVAPAGVVPSHASAPYQIGQDHEPDRPPPHEPENHADDQDGLGDIPADVVEGRREAHGGGSK